MKYIINIVFCLIIIFCILINFGNAQTITTAEFFVDADPGAGNGTPITVPNTASSSFTATVPTASLSNGFHFVSIRSKNSDGQWGLFETRGFYITTATANVSNITAAEFFVDTDPGVGNGTAIIVTAGSTASFVATVPTTALSNGFHFLAVRTKDAGGNWSLFESRGFYISSSTANAGNITAAEFFVDADPGVGNGTAITVTAGSTASFVATVPTTSLSNGFHFVSIRTKDADGNWGLFESRGFYISTQTTNEPNMVDAEYFIDSDPGVGNAFAFTIPSSQSISQNFALLIPAGTANGLHILAIRTKGADGKWGLFDTATFNVNSALPLRLLSFTGQKENEKVQLHWKTDNEVNTSHFEIEKSSNGISFSKMGADIPSKNITGSHNYTTTDQQPFDGINFYRLKQVDLNGSFTYSSIVKVLFSKYGAPLQIYPNPAAQYVQLVFADSKNKLAVQVYDAKGRQVITNTFANQQPLRLNIEKLSNGLYTVQISDGVTQQTGSFIKQ